MSDFVASTKALGALNDMQQLFVLACRTMGAGDTGSRVKAALAAGYGNLCETETLRVAAARECVKRLMRNPKILAALKEQAENALEEGALEAAEAALAIVRNPAHKDHWAAVKETLNRTGVRMVIHKQEIAVKHETTDDPEKIANIRRMAELLGVDARELLGQAGVVLDAEFKVVTEHGTVAALPAPRDEYYGAVKKPAPVDDEWTV